MFKFNSVGLSLLHKYFKNVCESLYNELCKLICKLFLFVSRVRPLLPVAVIYRSAGLVRASDLKSGEAYRSKRSSVSVTNGAKSSTSML